MKRFARALVLLVCVASAILTPVVAVAAPDPVDDQHCPGSIGGAFGTPVLGPAQVIAITAGPETLYLDVRGVLSEGSLVNVWLYRESNGREGLQRGDTNNPLPDMPCICDPDPCAVEQPWDELIF